MLPKLIINISLLSGCSATNIAALPDAILSLYFSIAFSFLITLDLTVIESPILAENDARFQLAARLKLSIRN